jgi:hypothetical protein
VQEEEGEEAVVQTVEDVKARASVIMTAASMRHLDPGGRALHAGRLEGADGAPPDR